MKQALVALFFVLSSTTAFAEDISGGEIISVTATSDSKLQLRIRSKSHCNAPEVSLQYAVSGRASFGPHYYGLIVTPTNRMNCLRTEEFTATIPVPVERQIGEMMVIMGDNGTIESVTL